MIENKTQIASALIPYLRLFIDRARADKPQLTQVAIPETLRIASIPLGVTYKTSFGMGMPTLIPWLACFLPGQTAGKEGVYPVILFRRDNNTVSVCYGVSATAQTADGNWPRKWPNELVAGLPHFGHDKYQESFELRLFRDNGGYDYEGIAETFLQVIDDYLLVPRANPPSVATFMWPRSRDRTALRTE